eukprot:TRINITY_DN4497_c1_g1_i2.p1 TRINITY_DN4497_c1_g1~~TRINITY_DN4497_c1_g1_i2.p1  ORF type:complete len:446 (+),score=101.24 TRINITY_DN4497_c1_g1_i2:105-1442(+)
MGAVLEKTTMPDPQGLEEMIGKAIAKEASRNQLELEKMKKVVEEATKSVEKAAKKSNNEFKVAAVGLFATYLGLCISLRGSRMFSAIHNPKSLAKMLNETSAKVVYPAFKKAIPEIIDSAPCAKMFGSISEIFNSPTFKLEEDSIIVAIGETGVGKTVALKRAIQDREGVLMVYFREPSFEAQFPFLFHNADSISKKFFRAIFFLDEHSGISKLSFDDGWRIMHEVLAKGLIEKPCVVIEGGKLSDEKGPGKDQASADVLMKKTSRYLASVTNLVRHTDGALAFMMASDSSLSALETVPHYGSRMEFVILAPGDSIPKEDMEKLLGKPVTEEFYKFVVKNVGANFRSIKNFHSFFAKCGDLDKSLLSMEIKVGDQLNAVAEQLLPRHIKILKSLMKEDLQNEISVNKLGSKHLIKAGVFYQTSDVQCRCHKFAISAFKTWAEDLE